MTRVAHIRMYPTDWRSGCMGLSLEQEGLYIRMCMFQAEANRRVPLDDSQAARMLGVNLNQFRKVLGQLLILGKITRHDNGYGNDRVEHERREADKAVDRKPSAEAAGKQDRDADPGPERQDRKATPPVAPPVTGVVTPPVTPPVQAEFGQQNQHPLREPESEPYCCVVDASDALARSMKIIVEEARPILRDGGMSAGLMSSAGEMKKWLAAGCDLDSDILPVIRAAVAKGEVRNAWTYFTQAIVNARAARLAPMPKPTLRRMDDDAPRTDRRPAWAIEQDRRRQAFNEAIKPYQ